MAIKKSSPAHPHTKVLMYARVSSKDQEKEGFSIPAQLKLLHNYAAENGFAVAQVFEDVETAKESGRTHFEEMIRYVHSHPTVRTILVEKTDRLYRNFKDWVRLDELDVAIHLVKEGAVVSKESRSTEKFMHGIKVLMAKNYIDNLSEETKKGMLEKAEQGIWPSMAPTGYRNVTAANGKQNIIVDPIIGPIITKLFSWYATGAFSVEQLAEKALEAGLGRRKDGGLMVRSTLHALLSKRIYTGDFDWKGVVYRGTHQPLVTYEIWNKVQDVLSERDLRKIRGKRDFAFSGLVRCGHCDCALVGEIKKGRYVYYHCTGYKGKCPEKYVREEVLGEHFGDALSSLCFDNDTLHFLRRALTESHAGQQKEHDEAVQRLQSEYDRLQARIHAAYIDKIDGTIDKALFEKLSNQWRLEQSICLEQIVAHQSADESYLAEGGRLLELATRSHELFRRQSPSEKRRMLNLILSNSTWENGRLEVEWRQPFDLIADTATRAAEAATTNDPDFIERTVWRPQQDSNLRPPA